MSRNIKASGFKAKCLALMDEVTCTGATFIIKKKGKPVAELVPHQPRKQSARGILKVELFIECVRTTAKSMHAMPGKP